jgi:hypothetical protein
MSEHEVLERQRYDRVKGNAVRIYIRPNSVTVHYFYPILFFTTLVAIPWLPWFPRYLRTLLIVTTLIAVGLGWLCTSLGSEPNRRDSRGTTRMSAIPTMETN